MGKLKDDLEEEQRVRQRMVEMQLAREEAIEAFEHCKRKKTIMAEHQKDELKQQLLEVEYEKHVDLANKQNLVAQMQEDRERTQVAVQDAIKEKCEKAEKLRKEMEA